MRLVRRCRLLHDAGYGQDVNGSDWCEVVEVL